MTGWLVAHLTGALGGSVLGIFGHLGTEAVGWLRDRQTIAKVESLATTKAQDDVQKASYTAAPDWLHWSLALILVSLFVAAAWGGAPNSLVHPLRIWAGLGIGWSFGRLTIRRK